MLGIFELEFVTAFERWEGQGFTVDEVCEDLFISNKYVSVHVAWGLESVITRPLHDEWVIDSVADVEDYVQAIISKVQEFLDRGRAVAEVGEDEMSGKDLALAARNEIRAVLEKYNALFGYDGVNVTLVVTDEHGETHEVLMDDEGDGAA